MEPAFEPVRPSARPGAKPLLGLVMIVKNENATIADTLDSVKDEIDHWTIVDTGSTDGTQDIIRATLEGIPGQLLSKPFVDFSTTRNFALKVRHVSIACTEPCLSCLHFSCDTSVVCLGCNFKTA